MLHSKPPTASSSTFFTCSSRLMTTFSELALFQISLNFSGASQRTKRFTTRVPCQTLFLKLYSDFFFTSQGRFKVTLSRLYLHHCLSGNFNTPSIAAWWRHILGTVRRRFSNFMASCYFAYMIIMPHHTLTEHPFVLFPSVNPCIYYDKM